MVLAAARARRFKAALDDYGLRGNPYALRPLAARIGVHTSTLHGWETGRGRPDSFAFHRRWAQVLGVRFAITIDGEEIQSP